MTLKKSIGTIKITKLDVTKQDEVDAAVGETLKEFGRSILS
jgi:NADP-dependent 3-hydroxy acid dehydrogenase YdfG